MEILIQRWTHQNTSGSKQYETIAKIEREKYISKIKKIKKWIKNNSTLDCSSECERIANNCTYRKFKRTKLFKRYSDVVFKTEVKFKLTVK